MPGPLSFDLRTRAVAAYETANLSIRAVAFRFGIGESTLKRWLWRKRRTGSLNPGPFRGPEPAISEAGLVDLAAVVSEQPDATRAELTARFNQRTGKSVSTSTIQRCLRRLGITRKKKTLHATERDSERVRGLRAEFVAAQNGFDPTRLVFIDEAGSNAAMTPRYARSIRGRRAHGHQPSHWGKNLTMIGAMRSDGLVTLMTICGATTGAVFLVFVRRMLCRVLRVGDIVVMDNLSAHKVDGVRQAIEQAGASVLYLPPYSPDLNPIELCWSKLKHRLRAAEARTLDDLNDAIAMAMTEISPANCAAWLRHCGYRTTGAEV